ncbi:MAG: hypothetical protein ACOYXY_09525 [Thermodesulfobacteriota bacterium]
MRTKPRGPWVQVLVGLCGCLLSVNAASGADRQYARYPDPQGRFSFSYPATMKVEKPGPDEVKIYHPGATLRINVFVEKRKQKQADKPSTPQVQPLLEALKVRLKQEMTDATVLEEGHLPGPKDRQGYLICYFVDRKATKHVQLVQYFVTERSLLQMVISDHPIGFKNLQEVIRKVHGSLEVKQDKL